MDDDAQASGTEQALRSALTDREVLFAELEHRVRNVMQMIAGFLSFQAAQATLPETKAALADVMRRIQGLDVAQRALLKLGAFDRVDLGAYLSAVLEELMTLEARPGVTCELAIQPVETGVDQASALGLVVSELAVNALKHAFPSGGGVIRLEVEALPVERCRVAVVDNGVGVSDDAPRPREGGLGMSLVEALSRQAFARLVLSGDKGMRAELEFPLVKPTAAAERGRGLPE